MNELRELSLFSGYGGFSLGLKLTGIPTRTVMYVEWERYPQEIIKARINDKILDDAPIWGDISTLDGEQFRGVVDIITGGFPCQPHSVAGLRRGADDERNLWPATIRIIREVRPRYVILENVPGILSASRKRGTPAYGGTVVGELAQEGYRVRWETVGADDVGAPHRRKRWLCFGELVNAESEGSGRIRNESGEERTRHSDVVLGVSGRVHDTELADSDLIIRWPGQEPREPQGGAAGQPSGNSSRELDDPDITGLQGRQQSIRGSTNELPAWPPSPSDTDGWEQVLRERPDLAPAITKEAESEFRGVANGRSDRVDRLKALGNGLIPSMVTEFLRRVTI